MNDEFPDIDPTVPHPATEIMPELDAMVATLAAERERLALAYPPRAPEPLPGFGAMGAALGDAAERLQAHVATPARTAELERRARILDAQRRIALQRQAMTLGVPEDEDLRAVVLDDAAPVTPAMAAVRRALAWRGDARRGLVLVLAGDLGVGKSAAMAHALVRYEGSALWVDACDVGATPRNGFSENAHLWERWLGVQLLAVDDVGTEGGDASSMVTLLTTRYNRGRATIVTSNLARKAFVARYLNGAEGSRLVDRLIKAQGRVVEVDGKRQMGPTGTPWYVGIEGVSLRSVEARAALKGEGR
jgi:hypothetical protein